MSRNVKCTNLKQHSKIAISNLETKKSVSSSLLRPMLQTSIQYLLVSVWGLRMS